MGSGVIADEAEVSSSDGNALVSGSKAKECSSFGCQRGTSIASGSTSWIKKLGTGFLKSKYLQAKSAAEDTLQGLDHGVANGPAVASESERRQVLLKVSKASRNGSGSLRKLQPLQADSLVSETGNDDARVELDMPGSQLVKCSYADKCQAAKQRNNLNGKRGDRRNPKVQMKSKFDSFSLKASFLRFSLAAGGSNAFGMYGLKSDVHDITKLMDDISLEDLLHGNYKCPLCKDKGKKTANVNDNTLDSVRKAYSLVQLQRLLKDKQTEELHTHVSDKNSSLSSPSNTSVENGSDGDGSRAAVSSKCSNDSEICMKTETSADVKDSPLCNPKDILEKLALPSPKDLESLLQDAVKPAASLKLSDLRSSKLLSHRASLPPLPWSHNFNGHHKPSNDTLKIANRSTCQGRWARIRSIVSFVGGDTDGFLDVDSLIYDDRLVPAGQLKYRFPEMGSSSITSTGKQYSPQSNSSAVRSTSLPMPEPGRAPHRKLEALHSPGVLSAARILCDIASCPKHNFRGIVKWPKKPSQKAMKARKFRSNEKPENNFLTPESETLPDHAIRSVEYRSSPKKPKITSVERREDFSHVPAVIGLSSVSAHRSNRSSLSRLSRDFVAEARHLNDTIVKSSFMVPAPPSVLDRNNHNPQKIRKVVPKYSNRTRS